MKLLPIVFVVSLFGSCVNDSVYAPVNPDASPEARQLLDFLYSIQGEYTLSGAVR